MAKIEMCNPTNRNTKAYVVDIGNTSLYFSYETLIAYQTQDESKRIKNYWGPTTGRHFNELGCSGFDEIDGDHFVLAEMAYDAIQRQALKTLTDRMAA